MANRAPDGGPAGNFIRDRVVEDNASARYGGRVATRFPPEPNGYLHIGHAKAICIDFGLAQEFGGTCNLRFDDTNPTTEDVEYVDAIKADIAWLGYKWDAEYYASDYFEQLYRYAEKLIQKGVAYVDSLNEEEIREYRGNYYKKGTESPYRNRSVEENLDLFRRMRAGEFKEGAHVLRAKIDLNSQNMNLRDPLLYRIRYAKHHRTGDKWCIYPLYDYAHPLSDAIEQITHSICTLEFEAHRPLYDWCIREAEAFPSQQIEFARGNLTYTVMSKRKLLQLVKEKRVDGWDDPRMPTLAGVRRRGFPPAAIRAFWERAGVTKQNSVIEFSVLEGSVREVLDASAPRRMAVLDPLKLVITNLDASHEETIEFANHPKNADLGSRRVPLSREIWIERDDFAEVPPKGFHRLVPNGEVRLRNVGIVRCVDVVKGADGSVSEVHCTLDPETRHGMPGADRKVKGTIHWVSAKHAIAAEVRLYDRLFTVADPDDTSDGKTYAEHLNRDSKRIVRAWLEPSLADAVPESSVQFERLGYFVADRHDHSRAHPVFNRTVTLRDSYAPR